MTQKTKDYKHIILVPSDANFTVFEANFTRLVEFSNRKDSLICLSINDNDSTQTQKTILLCQNLVRTVKECYSSSCPDFEFVIAGENKTFAECINKGLRFIKEKYGFSSYVTIINDHVLVTKNWLRYLERGTDADFCTSTNRLEAELEPLEIKEVFSDVQIGFAGPASYELSTDQGVSSRQQVNEVGLDTFASGFHSHNIGNYLPTLDIHAFCFCMKKEFINSLWDNEKGLVDETFTDHINLFQDLCLRAEKQKWIGIIVTDCFVGFAHQEEGQISPNSIFNSKSSNDILLAKKHYSNSQDNNNIVACYDVKIETLNDLMQLKSSISRSARSCDGIAATFSSNPCDVLQSYDNALTGQLNPMDMAYLEQCMALKDTEDEGSELKDLTTKWINEHLNLHQTRFEEFKKQNPEIDIPDMSYKKGVFIDFLLGSTDKEITNRTHHNASVYLKADWVILLDSDEILEDRISSELLKRWIKHPNSKFRAFNNHSLIHWDSADSIRTDGTLFANSYKIKLFKVSPIYNKIMCWDDEDRILSKSPEYGKSYEFWCSLRTRKLGFVREHDRNYLFESYAKTSKDLAIAYKSLLDKNVFLRKYSANNGIGFFMLSHDDEQVNDLKKWLDNTYLVSDMQAIVWTKKWADKDKGWLNIEMENLPSKEEWKETYKTGPCWEFAILSKLYTVDILHKELEREKDIGLAHCRNEAIEHFIDNHSGLKWCLFVDPDEEPLAGHDNFKEMVFSAEDENVLAYVFRFVNPLNIQDKQGKRISSPSECIRMFVLDPTKNFLMDGLVHEGFDKALKELEEKGITPKVIPFSNQFLNLGLSKNPLQMASKLKDYADLLFSCLEKDEKDAKSWVSLGLQFANDNNTDLTEKCFKNAVNHSLSTSAYLPFKELGTHYVRLALVYMSEASRRLSPKHPFASVVNEAIGKLHSLKMTLPIIDTQGYTISNDSDFQQSMINLGLIEEDIEKETNS